MRHHVGAAGDQQTPEKARELGSITPPDHFLLLGAGWTTPPPNEVAQHGHDGDEDEDDNNDNDNDNDDDEPVSTEAEDPQDDNDAPASTDDDKDSDSDGDDKAARRLDYAAAATRVLVDEVVNSLDQLAGRRSGSESSGGIKSSRSSSSDASPSITRGDARDHHRGDEASSYYDADSSSGVPTPGASSAAGTTALVDLIVRKARRWSASSAREEI